MSGDYSRKRFNPENHFQGVLRQQGRVDLDADWNEYVDMQDRRWRAETIDAIGRCGVPPETSDGFKIQILGNQFTICQGRIYVDGMLAENHGAELQFNDTLEENYGTAPILVTEQPYADNDTVKVPNNSERATDRRLLVVYLDVWRREVTYLQEPELIEPAVNVDTTARYQTAWQVKALVVQKDSASSVTCQTPLTSLPGWPVTNLPSAARLTTSTVAVSTESDPCLVPPSGGYRGLENHLYRVEVHAYDAKARVARVKWSSENAHVASEVIEILSNTEVRVASLGRDDVLRFKNGDWVEITSDKREFDGQAGDMRKVTVDEADLTLTFSDALTADLDMADHLRVILWDQSGSVLRPDGTELINLNSTGDGLILLSAADPSFVLEYGIQVTLDIIAGGMANAGDYWCFAARTADADVERLDAAPPLGIHHHFCKLALVDADGVIQDCRPQFPALTELTSLFYISGDGQETLPGQALPKPIQVGVANGKRPVTGASVRFHVTGGNGSLSAGASSGVDINVVTDSLGVASCVWTLDVANQSQQVEAMLADGSHLPARFNASLIQPGGVEPGVRVRRLLVGDKPLGNDTDVTVTEFLHGLRIECDANLFQTSVADKPVCFITLLMPFPSSSADVQLSGNDIVGFQPLILNALVTNEGPTILWKAARPTIEWLRSRLTKGDRILARLTLKGNFIWSEKDPKLYLDGELFGGQAAGQTITAVRFPSGDGRRGGDLEMWFWLIDGKPQV
jgi:Family of unknown function (DUF6519)